MSNVDASLGALLGSNEDSFMELDSALSYNVSEVTHVTGNIDWSAGNDDVVVPMAQVLTNASAVTFCEYPEFDDLYSHLVMEFAKAGVSILINAKSGAVAYYNPLKNRLSELSTEMAYIWSEIVKDFPEVDGYDHVAKHYKDLKTILQHHQVPFKHEKFAIGKPKVFTGVTGEFDENGKPLEGVFINTYSADRSAAGLPTKFLKNVTPEMVMLANVMLKGYEAQFKHAAKCSAVKQSDIPALTLEVKKQVAEYLQANNVRKKMSVLFYSKEGGTGKSVLIQGIANSLCGYDTHGKLNDFCTNDGSQFSNGWEKSKVAVLEEIEIQDALVSRYKALTTDIKMNCNRKYAGMTQEEIQFNILMTSNVLHDFHIGDYNRRLIAYNYDATVDNYYPTDHSVRVLLSEEEIDLLVSLSGVKNTSMPLLKVPKSSLKLDENGMYVVPLGYIGDMMAKGDAVDIRVRAMVAKTLAKAWDINKDSSNCITYDSRIETHVGKELNNKAASNPDLTLVIEKLIDMDEEVIDLTTLVKQLGLSLTGDIRKYFDAGNYSTGDDFDNNKVTFNLVTDSKSTTNYLISELVDDTAKAIVNYNATATPFSKMDDKSISDSDGIENVVEHILNANANHSEGALEICENELKTIQQEVILTYYGSTKNLNLYNGKNVMGWNLTYSKRNKKLVLVKA